jgi:hypothetical protein
MSEASQDLRAALAIYREIGTRWEEALTMEALAAHLLCIQDGHTSDEVTSLLESVQKIYEELHAEPDLVRMRNAVRLNGAKVHHDAR